MGICDNFLFTTSYHEGIGGIYPTWCKFAKIHPKYWWIWWPSQFCSPTPYYCQIFFSGDQNIDEADVKSFSFVWLMYQRDGRDVETVKWGKYLNIHRPFSITYHYLISSSPSTKLFTIRVQLPAKCDKLRPVDSKPTKPRVPEYP